MAKIMGFKVQNFRALKDISFGREQYNSKANELSELSVVIGKNGSGKTTLFDAFNFVADCLNHGVEDACYLNGRGGFDRLISKGQTGAMTFQIYYRQNKTSRPITYSFSIAADERGRPYVQKETLLQTRIKTGRNGQPFPFMKLENGKGLVWSGDIDVESRNESPSKIVVDLSDTRQLGIAIYGAFREHPRITGFRDFLKGWYLSYLAPDAMRETSDSGPQRLLSKRGNNHANVVQFLEKEHPENLKKILSSIASKLPDIKNITSKVSDEGKILVKFDEGKFEDTFDARHMSDGTLKIYAYYLLLESPNPPPFICIEEPENGLYHKLLQGLATDFRNYATAKTVNAPQLFVTTHQPYFVNALRPEEVWIMEKGEDGFSKLTQASDDELVVNLVKEGIPLGNLWFSDYLDAGSAQ